MASDLERVDGPEAEPVTLAEARSYCRIHADDGDDDAHVSGLIATARDFIERRTGRALGVQAWRERRTVPPDGVVRLFKAPIVEVLSADVGGEPASFSLAPGNRLRLEGAAGEVVVVEYRAGWATIPPAARLALLALVAHWYDRREPVDAPGAAPTPLHYEALESALSWGSEIPRR